MSGIIGAVAAHQGNEAGKSLVLDASRLVIKMRDDKGKLGQDWITKSYEYHESMMLEYEQWRDFVPAWLNGWEQRLKGTTQSRQR